MGKLSWFLGGVVAVLIVAAVTGFLLLKAEANGFSANAQPSFWERWAAREARAMAMPASAKAQANPVANSPDVLAEARAHWADHCAVCHANDGSGDTVMGKHMYPPAPDMRQRDTQNLTDGELFFIIQNGVRLTGMPAWASGSEHDATDSWKLVHFIRHLPMLTVEERREMEKLNPKGPGDRQEEEEEEKFLRGESNDEPQEHHHHH